MDSFIKDGLEYILKDPRYNFYVVKDDNEAIVAMFVYSEGKVIRGKDVSLIYPSGRMNQPLL